MRYILLSFLMINSLFIFSQPAADSTAKKVFTTVEQEASYPGGDEAWKKYFEKKLGGFSPAQNDAPAGRYTCIVQFIVSTDGSTSSIKAITKNGYGIEEKVTEVIEASGKWSPAMQNGKAVNAYRKQPVTFLVTSADFEIKTAVPYTLIVNQDNEIFITTKKAKLADIAITVSGAKLVSGSEGHYIIRPVKAGRVQIEITNAAKNDKLIGTASIEAMHAAAQ
jgi:hypothetical protein